MHQDVRPVGIREVVIWFLVGLFALGLLAYTGIANLSLLLRVYPDPAFVIFGLLTLEGGVLLWTVIFLLTHKHHSVHRGICLIGLGIDVIFSATGFLYEMSFVTHTALLVTMPVIYVMAAALLFNVGVSLCYKLIPNGTLYIPPAWFSALSQKFTGTVVRTTPTLQPAIASNTEEIPVIPSNIAKDDQQVARLLRIAEAAESQGWGLDRIEGMLGIPAKKKK